jgi:membrane protease YdiL (CAAX protease family)
MLALGVVALVPILMWLGQSALLWRAGLPIRLRIGAADLPRPLKRINRLVTNLAFAAALVGYPLLRGESPLAYYVRFVPLGARPFEALRGAAAAILYLTLLYLAWTVTDNVRFQVRHSAQRLVRRLAGVPLTAVLIALVEELLFRAVLLAGLLDSFAPHIALPVGIVVFAAAHYVRRVKRTWTFAGHLALGTLFCVAFFVTGRSLWLPLGLHAGGVLVLMGVRPFVRYTGPAWLVGASIFPYAGVVGIVALLLLTLNIWLGYGGTP